MNGIAERLSNTLAGREQMRGSERGSLWRRWDLHFHTPSSQGDCRGGITNQDIVQALRDASVAVTAVTDHNVMDVARIRDLQALGGDEITFFPGIELRSELGAKPVHYICLFPEDSDIDYIWQQFSVRCEITHQDIDKRGGPDKVYVPISTGARVAHDLGGVVSIHAGAKSNSIDGISNREQFQQRIKYDVAKNHIDIIEVGQLRDVDTYLNKIFPATSLSHPLIICSDCHDATNYAVKTWCWIKADPTFRGLRQLLKEPSTRAFIGARPPVLDRMELNRTKYIDMVTINKRDGSGLEEDWFHQALPLNPELVAIVGNKGSGKSALADIIGLLGNTQQSHTFSFLNEDRFCQPRNNKGAHFEATITWASGDSKNCSLTEVVDEAAVETVKYIPQNHLETICNELIDKGETKFQLELQSVIFSHVPEEERLGCQSLADLVRYRTEETAGAIRIISGELAKLSQEAESLEGMCDPKYRRSLEAQLVEKNKELKAHDQNKPAEVKRPESDPVIKESSEKASAEIEELARQWDDLEAAKASQKAIVSEKTKIVAAAQKLMSKIENLESYLSSFRESAREESELLGLNIDDLVTIKLDLAKLNSIEAKALNEKAAAQRLLEESCEEGPVYHIGQVSDRIAALRETLDRPNQEYQLYKKALAQWAKAKKEIEGARDIPDSILGLLGKIETLNGVPSRLNEVRRRQVDVALRVFEEKRRLAGVYSELYGPIQSFIKNHPLAADKFDLTFSVSMAVGEFETKFLSLINQGKKGPFQGKEEGAKRIRRIVADADFETSEGVRGFLEAIADALTGGARSGDSQTLFVKDQLRSGISANEFYTYLFSLGYCNPMYILRWEGKDLEELSPGERGTLLLVFYLLVDRQDIPLVIDQPEGNLDNQTVARVLIDCVREAKKRRQVVIVTHNPNLAVACDAEQIICASLDKKHKNKVVYKTGALENPDICLDVVNVLEGSRPIFDIRDYKYSVGEVES